MYSVHGKKYAHAVSCSCSMMIPSVSGLYLCQSCLPYPAFRQAAEMTVSGQWNYGCVQAMCGMAKPVFRLPYVPLSYEQRVEGAKLLRAVAEHLPGVTDIKVLNDDDFILIGRH